MDGLNDISDFVFVLLAVIGSLGFWAIITGAILYAIYFLLTLPMRRNERARLFLDLLELGLRSGQRPESAVVASAGSRDPMLGSGFFRLAQLIYQGQSLGQALPAVPRLVPSGVAAMLRAGEHMGDISRVLPACRRMLADGVSQVHGALNYVLLLTFAVTPALVVIPTVIKFRVLPSYTAVFSDMFEGSQLPAFTRLVFGVQGYFIFAVAIVLVLMWLLLLAYVGGPHTRRFFQAVAPGLVDRFFYVLPWRRKRLQRNFSAVLAALLDSGVPEADAVRLAGEATDNRVVQTRATQVSLQLAEGIKLPAAIGAIDRSRELHWRLVNALHRGTGFLRALAGWHEALDAKAFQQEQAAAQIVTTLLVLFNGFVVASIMIAMFLGLIALLHFATLW